MRLQAKMAEVPVTDFIRSPFSIKPLLTVIVVNPGPWQKHPKKATSQQRMLSN